MTRMLMTYLDIEEVVVDKDFQVWHAIGLPGAWVVCSDWGHAVLYLKKMLEQ